MPLKKDNWISRGRIVDGVGGGDQKGEMVVVVVVKTVWK